MGTARRRFVASLVVGSLAALSRAGGTLLIEHTTDHPGQFGWNVSTIGDVDKDGVADYAIGSRGAAYVSVYSGADRSFLYGFAGTGFFGWSIAPYADVDADGRTDFLVGAPTLNGPSAVPGHVRVCSGLDGSEIRRVTGFSASERFGVSVAAIGDVNADSVPDFAVGAPGGGGISSGAVRAYSGQDGSEITALAKFGSTFRDNLGASVAGVGDVNGDGVPDFAAGAPGADRRDAGTGVSYGRVIWISGKDGAVLRKVDGKSPNGVFGEAISACGDQDGDGVTDLLVGSRGAKSLLGQATIHSGRTGKKLFAVTGITPRGFFGIGVAGLDDFDGDGRAEIAVGAEIGGSGEVVVISPGKKALYLHARGGPNDLAGDFIARAGDLDGDGQTELLVGAWGADKARVFKIDATPLPLPAAFAEAVKLLPPEGSMTATRGSVRLSVRGAVFTATVSAKKLPVAPGKTYTVFLEDGVATSSFFSIGNLTVTPAGKGKITLVAQYLPPPQFQVTTFAELSGRRVELRDGATVVLTGTVP